jgi:hypothetical protein
MDVSTQCAATGSGSPCTPPCPHAQMRMATDEEKGLGGRRSDPLELVGSTILPVRPAKAAQPKHRPGAATGRPKPRPARPSQPPHHPGLSPRQTRRVRQRPVRTNRQGMHRPHRVRPPPTNQQGRHGSHHRVATVDMTPLPRGGVRVRAVAHAPGGLPQALRPSGALRRSDGGSNPRTWTAGA